MYSGGGIKNQKTWKNLKKKKNTNPNSGCNSGSGAVTTSCVVVLLYNPNDSLQNISCKRNCHLYYHHVHQLIQLLTVQMIAWLWNISNVNTAHFTLKYSGVTYCMQYAFLCFVIHNSVAWCQEQKHMLDMSEVFCILPGKRAYLIIWPGALCHVLYFPLHQNNQSLPCKS